MFAGYFFLPILRLSPISDISSSLPQPFNSRFFNFLALMNCAVPSSTLLLIYIAYENTPLSLGEYNKNSGLFLIHQEIDSAQHKRLGKVIFTLRPILRHLHI